MTRLFTTLLIACAVFAHAQSPKDIAVSVTAAAGINPPGVVLSWDNPGVADLHVRKREKDQPGNAWTTLINQANSFQNGLIDVNVVSGKTYEYAVERKSNGITAHGFAHVSLFAPVVDYRGKLLVFIDSTTADELGTDLKVFKDGIRGEGWETVPFKTGPFTTVQWVKSQIQAQYNADPNNVKAVLLMGPVPIPYSGSNAWDTKPDHVGAWPADAYYGDIEGAWTDNTVNIPNTARVANKNVPGDGKFDQNTIPTSVELPVGRLDFRRLTANTFGLSPIDLLRRYIYKNNAYRTGQVKVPNRALVDDNIGWAGGEAFAADGYRNAYPLMSPDNVAEADILNNTNPDAYILGYGSGIFSVYEFAPGLGGSANFATDTINIVFSNLYGDYFGDWDYETNPLMPALLASRGQVLTCAWAGRPRWFMHGLASGEPIGYCLRETQNAQFNEAYGDANGEGGAHVSLLGDPTLRAQVVTQPSNFVLTSNCNRVNMSWTASPDSGILGYYIYRSMSADGPFMRISQNLITDTQWADMSPVSGLQFYAVRAVKLESTRGGGVYYNSSSGLIKEVTFTAGNPPTAIGLGGFINCNNPSITLGVNFQPFNATYLWYKPDGSPLNGVVATEPGVYRVVVTAPNGCTAEAFATVIKDDFVPPVSVVSNISINCVTPSGSFTVPAAIPNTQYLFNNQPVMPGLEIPLSGSGTIVFTVVNTQNGCKKDYPITVVEDFNAPGAFASSDGGILGCNATSVQLTGTAFVNGAVYSWSGGDIPVNIQNPIVTLPGTYCLTTTGTNGCTSQDCVTVLGNVNAPLTATIDAVICTSPLMTNTATVAATGGNMPYTYSWSNGSTNNAIQLLGFSGALSVIVTDNIGCVTADSVMIVSGAQVLAQVTSETAPGGNGAIDLLVIGGTQPITFLWSNGATTEDIIGLTAGTYTVTITAGGICSSVLTIQLSTSSVVSPEAAKILTVSPNPADGYVQVSVNAPVFATVQLYSSDGRLIETQSAMEKTFRFDTRTISSGIYLIRWQTSDGVTIRKVVIQH